MNRTMKCAISAAFSSTAKWPASVGVLQPGDDADYYCWTKGPRFTWTFLRNLRTGVRGWVRDDLLRKSGPGSGLGGSNVKCQ